VFTKFTKAWPDEEADAEAQQDPFGFQTSPADDPFNGEMTIICDHCYQEMAAWATAHGGIEKAMTCAMAETACTHM
jgi:hypothetical protein